MRIRIRSVNSYSNKVSKYIAPKLALQRVCRGEDVIRALAQAVVSIGLLSASVSHAEGRLTCGVNPATEAHICVDLSALKEGGDGYRTAPLFMGGPKQVHPSNYTVHVSCAAEVLILKDADGVRFGGGRFSDTPQAKQLGRAVCAQPMAKPKAKT